MQQSPAQPTIAGPWLANPDLRIWVAIVALAIVAIIVALLNRSSSDVLCQLFDDYETTRSETHLVLMALGTKGLTDYKIVEGQICVVEKLRAEYLAAIKEQDALPQIYDVQEELTPNPFLLRNQQLQQELNRKKQHVRNMVLRLPDVNEVLFEMDVIESGSPFKPDQQSAAVMVSMSKGSVLTSQHVTTIQGIVCGSFAAIEPTKVFITDANLGVSYHDLSDLEQAKLIKLVNWKKQRRQFYLEKLQELSTTFPQLEISVDVSRPDSNDSILELHDKVATTIPPISVPRIQTSGHLTLNGEGTIDDMDSSHSQMVVDHSVVKAAYIGSEPIADTQSKHQRDAVITEIIKIEIRVPNQVIDDFQLAEANDKPQNTGKFEGLKAQILAKISSIIPSHVLAASPPISIYPKLPQSPAPDARALKMARLLQTYWPVLAVVLIGVGFISISRTSSSTNVTSDVQPELAIANEEEQLQNQLSDLIDNDPEAAAKVIKNWIRNAA